MASSNTVKILVYDESENPLNLQSSDGGLLWQIGFGPCVVSEGKDYSPPPTYSIGDSTNEIAITFDADRHRTTRVSDLFIADGYALEIKDIKSIGTVIPPDVPALNVNQGVTQSATMSVHGEYATPKKMNFYFPVTITTDTHLVIRLLLGQTGTGPGSWLAIGKDIANIGKSVVGLSLSVAANSTLGAVVSTLSLKASIADLIGTNPWYVTAIGDSSYPSQVVPDIKIGGEPHAGILFVGPTSDGCNQVGCFYYDGKSDDYTFKLKLFNPVKQA